MKVALKGDDQRAGRRCIPFTMSPVRYLTTFGRSDPPWDSKSQDSERRKDSFGV